jgi:hypothetical protein
MKIKEIKNLNLAIINSGRITDNQMNEITGGTITSCGYYIKCNPNDTGKNICDTYSQCGLFSKTSCDEKYWIAAT